MKDLTVYVAGHRGLVGSSIVGELKRRGYSNLLCRTSQELDLRRQSKVESFFEGHRPRWVFLAAAKVGGILANDTYKAEFIYDNMAIALSVIHSAYKYGVKKLLNLGSSCIYPRNCPQPMREEHLLTGSLEATNEPYAIAKISAIKLCRYYNEQYGTNFISVMPTNLYGPGDNFNLETAHALPALMRKFHLARLLMEGDWEGIVHDLRRYPLGFGLDQRIELKKRDSIKEALSEVGIEDGSVTVWGSGEVYREFLYVDDLADACLYLMENVDAKDLAQLLKEPSFPWATDYFVNVGTGKDIKLKDLFHLVKGVVGYKGDIRHDLSKPDGTPRKLLDVSRIHQLGWQPKVSLEEGIKKTYQWYVGSGTRD